MDAFVWDERFVTGLASVDAQHQHWVELVNNVGDLWYCHWRRQQ